MKLHSSLTLVPRRDRSFFASSRLVLAYHQDPSPTLPFNALFFSRALFSSCQRTCIRVGAEQQHELFQLTMIELTNAVAIVENVTETSLYVCTSNTYTHHKTRQVLKRQLREGRRQKLDVVRAPCETRGRGVRAVTVTNLGQRRIILHQSELKWQREEARSRRLLRRCG